VRVAGSWSPRRGSPAVVGPKATENGRVELIDGPRLRHLVQEHLHKDVTDVTEHLPVRGSSTAAACSTPTPAALVGWAIDFRQRADLATSALGMVIDSRAVAGQLPGGIIHGDHEPGLLTCESVRPGEHQHARPSDERTVHLRAIRGGTDPERGARGACPPGGVDTRMSEVFPPGSRCAEPRPGGSRASSMARVVGLWCSSTADMTPAGANAMGRLRRSVDREPQCEAVAGSYRRLRPAPRRA
jgi:hypothetical protein